jgi:hypothetical protein
MAVVHPYLPPAEMNAAAFLADIAASNGSKIANKDYGKVRQLLGILAMRLSLSVRMPYDRTGADGCCELQPGCP